MQDNKTMKRELGLLDATLLVAGSMIGSGIFIVAADITRNVGSAGWLIAIWVITGIMTMIAAMSYGELSAMYPKAGGQYVYLKESYNSLVAFLYGWSFFAVIQTGSIAAVGVAFSKFTAYLIPQVSEDIVWFQMLSVNVSPAQILSIVTIFILTLVNIGGVKSGKIIQTSFTITKLLSLFGLIVFGFWALKPEIWTANWHHAFEIKKLNIDGTFESYTLVAALGAVAAAMVGSIFSSDAWNCVTFIAGEIKNPKRNIGLSLFLGTIIVSVIYILANVVYLGVLPLHEIATADKDRVAVAASSVIFGDWGTIIIALLIMVSTFGCNNGLVLSGARVYYTMAQDGLFFKQVGTLNKNQVPAYGLWLQFIVASVLCLSGKYGDLLDMISFVVVLFYILTIAGIFILRVKHPQIERPYKAFGYPILPALYIVMSSIFCVMLLIYKPNFTWPGILIVLLGIPLYFMMKKKV